MTTDDRPSRPESSPPESTGFPWGLQYRHRREVSARYPSVFSIPIERRPRDVLLRNVDDGMRVLDVGAGPRRAGDRIQAVKNGVEYRTLDPDPGSDHDYRRMEDVEGKFDRVLLFELLEHLSPEDSARLLEELRECIVPGGRLIVTTPNVFHPTSWFRDMTHRTPIAYDELGGLLERCGYRLVELVRIHNAPWLAKVARRVLLTPLHRSLGVDYARSVMAIAEV